MIVLILQDNSERFNNFPKVTKYLSGPAGNCSFWQSYEYTLQVSNYGESNWPGCIIDQGF